ncbi:MAG: phosphotransferase [Nocardia sp.]|nr:phosphotransferase [Nocardia sp.]
MSETAGVVVDADQISPQWLSRALSAQVDAVTATPVGTGQMGSVFRLEITGPAVPSRLMAKLPTADAGARDLVAGAYRQELRFYTEIAPTVSIRVPGCRYAEFTREGAEFTLLLDDLAPATQGDQLTGCSVAQAHAAVRNLAGLHGPRWCDPVLKDIEGLAPTSAETAEMLAGVYGPAVDIFLDKLSDQLAAEDHDTVRACVPGVAGWLLAGSERFAPVHGDYRLDNLMFGAPDDSGEVEVWAVDWQTLALGLPARDLAYFIGTSLDPRIRRTHEDALIETYWRALCAHGVTGYSLESCHADYRFALPQGPLIAVFGAAYGTPTPRGEQMFAAMVRRSCAAIRDWDSLSRLPG